MWIPKIDRKADMFECWHPYWEWEEVRSNMWGSVEDRKAWIQRAIELTGNHELYGAWMLRVVRDWPISTKHNLTKNGDKRSWVGHAAVAYAINCPESIVREAWGRLTQEQRDAANTKADEAIAHWRKNNA